MIRQVKKGGKTLEYDLRRTERRSLECRMSEEGAVLFAPMRTKTSEADAFILQHFDRILSSLERLKKNSEAREKQLSESLTDGALIPVEGRPHALRLKPGARLAARIANGLGTVLGYLAGDSIGKGAIVTALRQERVPSAAHLRAVPRSAFADGKVHIALGGHVKAEAQHHCRG